MPTLSVATRAGLVALVCAAFGAVAGSATAAIDAAPTANTVAADACAAPGPGQIGCDAQVLVSRHTRKPVHPAVKSAVSKRLTGHTLAAGGQAAPQTMTPAYLQQAYDLTYLSSSAGHGDTVAVVAVYNDPTAESDLATFRSTYGLPACTSAGGCFQQLNEAGQPAPLPADSVSWGEEESMDLDAVSALCPNCKIDLVEASSATSQGLQAAITAAIGAGANQVSISGAGSFSQNPFTDFSAPGVSILAATGDAGQVPAGQANYPAALPYVTAVGGTTLTPDSPSAPTPRGVTESTWSGAGYGCDTTQQPLPYQPQGLCAGRAYADISADADPNTGLTIYDSQTGGWVDGGGTSLATPLTAAFEAVTGVADQTPQWAYTDAPSLNVIGAPGYNAPTGEGSISGQVATGAPGIGMPALGVTDAKSYVRRAARTTANLLGGVYPNGRATSYYWQYGKTSAYGLKSAAVTIAAGATPVSASAALKALQPGTTYHYRLVATNASGTSYGYDYTLTTTGHAGVARAKHTARKR